MWPLSLLQWMHLLCKISHIRLWAPQIQEWCFCFFGSSQAPPYPHCTQSLNKQWTVPFWAQFSYWERKKFRVTKVSCCPLKHPSPDPHLCHGCSPQSWWLWTKRTWALPGSEQAVSMAACSATVTAVLCCRATGLSGWLPAALQLQGGWRWEGRIANLAAAALAWGDKGEAWKERREGLWTPNQPYLWTLGV